MKQFSFSQCSKEIFSAILKAAGEMNLSVQEKNREGFLFFEYAGDILSFGNKIDVEVLKDDDGKNVVKVISISKFQLLDWGTNDRIENELINGVKRQLGV